ncbi:tRNA (guanosine(46)-N7)-methyltransferase TrmB [Arundinibacter roseus]|uniref:tRNA (guanine-N(7)-)-methyltransferase n=1 Tax=Arundinibacter roseus TaxID=2070510 RepID=A0A4R4KJC4_9BACT|nr:tRNA (guanosine(46)-N7)-methyltransferase TrmB [Arundinibacter roseus]TDB66956.1 tRNA (guanosine(46)-N7)-methyltransferase TrmB [Arundinibacter roseus]
MTRRKTDKYLFSNLAENVIERGKPLYTAILGKWNELYFQNQNPIVVELACGKGEYTVGLAQKFPDKNFIGVDLKGDRIARGSKLASDLGLTNVAFLRTSINYLDEFFEENEISELWLIHPDPHVRDRDEKKRLTNPFYLKKYIKYLKAEGFFHFKTDNPQLFTYSLDTIKSMDVLSIQAFTSDLYQSDLRAFHHDIETHYERVFVAKGFTINYIQAVNNKAANPKAAASIVPENQELVQ